MSDGVIGQSLRVYDLLNAVVSGPRYFPHDLVDVVHCDSEQSGGQTIASASVLDKENYLINGARYLLIYRMCPGCPFCPLPCSRMEPHIICAHSERSDPLSHLWYLLPRGPKQRRMESSTFGRLAMYTREERRRNSTKKKRKTVSGVYTYLNISNISKHI